ncbi:MAG: Hsp70 family protein [Pseudomonadota bacterium]
MLAVPAMFDDLQRQAIRDAGRIAGLNVLGLVTEPAAAVLGSAAIPGQGGGGGRGRGRDDDSKVLVYDLGAGSFDVAALQVSERGVEVLASGGDAFLGGEDFDQRIVTFICEEILRTGGGDLRRDRSLLARLKVMAERVKIELSTSRSVDIQLPGPPGRVPVIVRLDRERLETLTKDLIDRTVWACESVVRDAKWTAGEIDVLLLVGGQTRMPGIRTQLDDVFGKEPLEIPSPDLVVAAGAARRAVSIVGGGRWRGRARDRVSLTELTCLSLGLESAGGVFARLIPRGTQLPAARSQVISTAADGQTQISIHLLQGEREMAADNESVAHIHIGPLPSRPRGEVQVEVSISTDGGGLPSATARALPEGEAKQVRLRPSGGLSDAEIAALAAVHAGTPGAAVAVALTADLGDAPPEPLADGETEQEMTSAPGIDPRAHGG